MEKTPLQIKQLLHRLELDEIYWCGLQRYSRNRVVQDMATRNLAEIKRRKDALQVSVKEPKNLSTNGALNPTHNKPTVFELDRNTRETIETYLQAHYGDDYRPSSIDPA
jgi:hypothetical protein